MTKNAARREKFQRIGEAISRLKIGDPDARDYHTGRDSAFEMKRFDPHDRLLHETPLGPNFNTPQWVKGANRS